MQLIDLFETIGHLAPGQRIEHPELSSKANNTKIRDKERSFNDVIWQAHDLKSKFPHDTATNQALDNLITRAKLKINYLGKMKNRLDTSKDKMLQILQQDCSDFLDVLKSEKQFLLRGVATDVSVFEARSREDRKPKDSKAEAQEIFDAMCVQAGIEARRGNSIFTTTSPGFAGNYGHALYLIFPKNGFEFLWTNRRDLILDSVMEVISQDEVLKYFQQIQTWVDENIKDKGSISSALSDILAYIKTSAYITTTWRMLTEYYNVHNNPDHLPEEFKPDAKKMVTLDAWMKSFEPNNSDLRRGMSSGHEVLIHGEYWALKRDDWNDFMRDKIFYS